MFDLKIVKWWNFRTRPEGRARKSDRCQRAGGIIKVLILQEFPICYYSKWLKLQELILNSSPEKLQEIEYLVEPDMFRT